MEVTTVSPSPASPTEWDNLCEIDVSNVAIHSVTLLFSLCGLVGNGAVLFLLGLKLCNAAFDLALVDFLFLLFTVPSTLLFLVEDMSCIPILPLPYLSFLFRVSVASYYWAVIRLMFTSSVVYMHRLCNLCCHCSLTKRLRWAVYSVQSLAIFALFTVFIVLTYWCPSQQQKQCLSALISMYTVILLLLVAPMLIFLTMNFIQATWGSKEPQHKRHDIVIFLIVLFIPLLGHCDFLKYLGYTVVSSHVVFLLNCIYNSIKPLIYFLVGRCWRHCSVQSLRLSLQRVFDEPEENTARSNDAPEDEEVSAC